MKALVTGVAGFIGSSLALSLLDRGYVVVGLDNLSSGFQSNIDAVLAHKHASNFHFLDGDIREFNRCKKACEGVDYVFHQAALGSVPGSIEEPLRYEENNVQGLLNMLVCARDAQVKRFVFASSSSVYGDTPVLPKAEDQLPSPQSPYAVNKLAGEHYCSVFYQMYGLPTVSLRYFNVFGPRQNPSSQYSAVIPKFISAFLSDKAPTIYGDGEQTRDFVYIDTVVDANLAACEAGEDAFGRAMNVGCGDKITINDLFDKLKSISTSTLDPIYESVRAGDIKDSSADVSLLKELLGVGAPLNLDEGLAKTYEWYVNNTI